MGEPGEEDCLNCKEPSGVIARVLETGAAVCKCPKCGLHFTGEVRISFPDNLSRSINLDLIVGVAKNNPENAIMMLVSYLKIKAYLEGGDYISTYQKGWGGT